MTHTEAMQLIARHQRLVTELTAMSEKLTVATIDQQRTIRALEQELTEVSRDSIARKVKEARKTMFEAMARIPLFDASGTRCDADTLEHVFTLGMGFENAIPFVGLATDTKVEGANDDMKAQEELVQGGGS